LHFVPAFSAIGFLNFIFYFASFNKAPHTVTFIKELPKTATGEIQKYVLRARRSESTLQVGRAAARTYTGAERACWIFCLEQRVNANGAGKIFDR
jgi:hypothetical protein